MRTPPFNLTPLLKWTQKMMTKIPDGWRVFGDAIERWFRLSEQIFRVDKWRSLPGLGCQADWQFVEVGLIGCGAVKARMRSPAVVEVQVFADRRAGLADTVVGLQIHLLIFDAAPQPLDEDVVSRASLSVHADRNVVVGEHAGERRARELRTLIGIEDVRLAVNDPRRPYQRCSTQNAASIVHRQPP